MMYALHLFEETKFNCFHDMCDSFRQPNPVHASLVNLNELTVVYIRDCIHISHGI